MTFRQKSLAAIIACVLFWGFSFISTKEAVAVFPPMTLGAIRFGLSIVFLIIIENTKSIKKTRKNRSKEKLDPQDIPLLFGAGLIGCTLYFFFENNGIALVSASEASIIIGVIPILTMISEGTAGLLGLTKERGQLGFRQWSGAILSVAGVYLVTGEPASSGNLQGYLFMAGAAASWVAYCFLTKPLFTRKSQLFIVFWQSVFGFMGFIPFAIIEFPRWGRPDTAVILHIVFLGVFCSAIGYLLYVYALEGLGVSISSLFINLTPVITAITGFFLLGERLTPIQCAGAVLVIGGMFFAVRRHSPKAKNRG